MSPTSIHSQAVLPLLVVAAFAALTVCPANAQAQVKQPGAHPLYSVELEPHILVQHSHDWRGENQGVGVGIRASVPIIDNGPIRTINNSFAIGFGLDWTRFSDCDGRVNDDDCNVNQVWIPVVAQWNFFLTPVISVFGEPGIALVHRSLSYNQNCISIDDDECSDDYFDPFHPVFYAGARFLFSRNIGLVVRLGTPSVSVGATFLM